jgi:hypothetical protein
MSGVRFSSTAFLPFFELHPAAASAAAEAFKNRRRERGSFISAFF